MKRLILLFLIAHIGLNAQTEKKGNVITDANDAARLVVAKQKLLAGEYVSALNIYREVSNRNPQEAATKYYVGLCQFYLQKFAESQKTLEEAAQLPDVKPQTWLVLAKIYQLNGEFEKALAQLLKFKSSGSGSDEEMQEAELLISQCGNAVSMMQKPVPVKVSNLGPGINSKYDDKNPCITADGRSLIFTTRRPETTSSPTDIEGDGKYFENIYMANADSATGAFVNAAGVSKSINTEAHDACTSISPDGKQIFIYKNDAAKKSSRGGNIFVSKVSGGKWRTPEALGKPINSTYWEGGACVSPDGRRYFFSSEREGGSGNSDIWMAEMNDKKEWGKPVNLGPGVNTPHDEAGMFLAPDGKTLFFCSNGPGSMGSYDVFRTIFENGKWSAPENLGYPINTAAKEGQLTLSADARYAYISSTRAGGLGEADIYMIDLAEYPILEKDFKKPGSGNGLSVLRGTIREGNEGYGLPDVEVSVTNEQGQSYKTTTGDTGEYFYTLPAGKYTLSITKKGYLPINEEVKLEKSEKGDILVEKGYLLKKQ